MMGARFEQLPSSVVVRILAAVAQDMAVEETERATQADPDDPSSIVDKTQRSLIYYAARQRIALSLGTISRAFVTPARRLNTLFLGSQQQLESALSLAKAESYSINTVIMGPLVCDIYRAAALADLLASLRPSRLQLVVQGQHLLALAEALSPVLALLHSITDFALDVCTDHHGRTRTWQEAELPWSWIHVQHAYALLLSCFAAQLQRTTFTAPPAHFGASSALRLSPMPHLRAVGDSSFRPQLAIALIRHAASSIEVFSGYPTREVVEGLGEEACSRIRKISVGPDISSSADRSTCSPPIDLDAFVNLEELRIDPDTRILTADGDQSAIDYLLSRSQPLARLIIVQKGYADDEEAIWAAKAKFTADCRAQRIEIERLYTTAWLEEDSD